MSAAAKPPGLREAADADLLAVARRGTRLVPALGVVYVNNAKAGCSTIKQSLWIASGAPYGGDPHARDGAPFKFDVVASAESFEAFRAAPAFSVVRNPFARVLSGYLEKTQRHATMRGVGAKLAARYGEDVADLGFADFLARLAADDPWAIDQHFCPQVVNLMVPHVAYRHIGHLERLGETFAWLGIAGETYGRHSMGAASRLAAYYEDGRAVDLVRRLYAADFARFGYSEDPAVLDPVAAVSSAALAGDGRVVALMQGFVGLSLRPRKLERRLRRQGRG